MDRLPRPHHRGRAPRAEPHGAHAALGQAAFAVVAFALLVAAALSFVLPLAALGVPLAALALWLARFDIARRTSGDAASRATSPCAC
ncbi:MAG: hypothetical protein M5U28_17020 [Sandaracinaceae bacterium]|nr:hypothetical protein [Sandaracinaceae bacterium]